MAFPSTFVDLQNEVLSKTRLNVTTGTQADRTKVKDWLNQVYAEVCIEVEANQVFATMTLTANTSTYTLDANLTRIKAMYVTPVGGTASRPLEPISIEQLLVLNAGTGGSQPNTGGPNRFALFGISSVQFYPTPASADTVTVYYVKEPTALTNDSDTTILPEPYATRCLVAGACIQAGQFVSDPATAGYQQEFEMWKSRLRGHLRRKQGAYTTHFRIVGDALTRPHDPSVDIR